MSAAGRCVSLVEVLGQQVNFKVRNLFLFEESLCVRIALHINALYATMAIHLMTRIFFQYGHNLHMITSFFIIMINEA